MAAQFQVGLVLTVVHILSVVLCGVVPQAEDDPALMRDECLRLNCSEPLCYAKHPSNCLKFIMCRPAETMVLSQVMPCAFGTRWRSSGNNGACDRHDLVPCSNDPCMDPALKSIKHEDSNCRTYWRCDAGKSAPACCPKYQRYEPLNSTCVDDAFCISPCPLLNDANCDSPGVQSIDLPDGNCRTYWDCGAGTPSPVCCPVGLRYDVITSTCFIDSQCTDSCPENFKEAVKSCMELGVTALDLEDGNCRTYLKCNEEGVKVPSCCIPGQRFDNVTRTCVDARGMGRDCTIAMCPHGHKEECRQEAIPGNPKMYKNLDAFGGTVMPCAIPLIFDPQACQCVIDISKIREPPPGCSIDIHARPPVLENLGTAVAALLMIGSHGQGERAVGNMSNYWDGTNGIVIPFYGSQWLQQFYLEIKLRPVPSSGGKEVILSSCEYPPGHKDRQASLELSVDRNSNQGNVFRLRAHNSDVTSYVNISMPFMDSSDYVIRVIYDSKQLGMFVDTSPPSAAASKEIQPLMGMVPIHISGLRFAHCRYEKDISSFVGFVSEIKFSKCVTPEMSAELNQAMP